MLERTTFISFDTDVWTSDAHHGYMSLIAHCIFENFEQQYIVLNSKHFPERHTSENILTVINDMIQQWGIPNRKCHIVCHDNASNITNAIASQDVYGSIPCFIHTSQLIIKDILNVQRDVNRLVVKCKALFSHFSRSALSHRRLEQIQVRNNQPVLKPLGAVATRWDSTVTMLQRFKQIQSSIVVFLTMGYGPDGLQFSGDDWRIMDMIIELLTCMKTTTQIFQKRYTSASEIIPQIQILKYMINNRAMTNENIAGIQSTVEALRTAMNTRYQDYLKSYFCIVATYLDPRYKEYAFHPALPTAEPVMEQSLEKIEYAIKQSFKTYYYLKQQEHDVTGEASASQSQEIDASSFDPDDPDDFDPSSASRSHEHASHLDESIDSSQHNTSSETIEFEEPQPNSDDIVLPDLNAQADEEERDEFDDSQQEEEERMCLRSSQRFDREDFDLMFSQSQEEDVFYDRSNFPGFNNPENVRINQKNHSDIKDLLFGMPPADSTPTHSGSATGNDDENGAGSPAEAELARQIALLESDIQRYKSLPRQDLTGNPLSWWKSHRAAMPYLAIVAAKYLGAPASSVDSERLFSAGGQIISKLRTRITPDNAEMLIFLAANLSVMPKFTVEL